MIEILQHQADFINSNARHTGLVGGFRSGKSHAGVIKTIIKKLALPNVNVAYYLPTYPLIKDIAFPKFTEILTEQGIPFELNRSDKDIHTPFGKIIMRSMDIQKAKMKDVMIKILARNSVRTAGNNNATDFVSTPEGFRFLHEFFVKNESADKKLIRASTKNNPFISDDYIKSLQDEYTEEQLMAYLEGQFVNLTSGSVCSGYDRLNNHSNRKVEDVDTLHIGVDFNIMKMAGIVHVIDEGEPIAVDEFIDEYDTEHLSKAIKRKYPNHKIVVYPDASGKNRKSSASDTDIDILKKYGFIVKALNSNPPVKDRINTMNKKFEDLSYKVNRFNCPRYVECLEQLPYKNGEPDKTLDLDHPFDAAGYFIYFNYQRKKRFVGV
jgi:hypothetical protein